MLVPTKDCTPWVPVALPQTHFFPDQWHVSCWYKQCIIDELSLPVIPFKEPAIAPSNEDEEDTFTEFEELLPSGVMLSMAGWAISLGKAMSSPAHKEAVSSIKEKASTVGGTLQNWSLLCEEVWSLD